MYVKEFTDYWPSAIAWPMYLQSLQQIPVLQAMCPTAVETALKIATIGISCNSICRGVLQDPTVAADMIHNCEQQVVTEVVMLSARIPPQYAYGTPPQKYHNLIRIKDADGREVVSNEYGSDPFQASFDRVTKQTLGGDATNVTIYDYTDLTQSITAGRVSVHVPSAW
jgi:hypothetical protein